MVNVGKNSDHMEVLCKHNGSLKTDLFIRGWISGFMPEKTPLSMEIKPWWFDEFANEKWVFPKIMAPPNHPF